MNNVLELIKHEQQEQQRQQLAEYFGLLAGMDMESPSAADAAKLADLMTALHKNPEQVQRDLAEIASVRQHLEHAADRDGKSAAAAAAYEKYMAACTERQEGFAALNAQVTAALLDSDDAQNAFHTCQRSTGELVRLKELNPILHDAIVVKATRPTAATAATAKRRK